MKKSHVYTSLTVALCCLGATQAKADSDFPIVTSVETNYIGLGVGMVPDYMGSDDYDWGVLPAFRYEFGNHRNVEIVGNYASMNLIDHDIIKFGPALRYRFGRDDDVDDDAVALLPEIEDTLEAGARLDTTWILGNNPRNRFALGLDTLWDVGGESDGFNATASARAWGEISKAVDLGISGNIMYGDENFTDTYFGISPAASAASGLATHSADGGIVSYSIQPMVAVHLSENWHVGAGVRYTRLSGDAADSPVVDDRGNENQLIGGIGVVYSWGSRVNTR